MSGSIRSKAIILSRVNYGEADRIMQLITPDNGKISAIAKGVRREKSKLAGGIELLAVSDLTLHQSKGTLMVVTSARLENFFSRILEDYARLQFAYYVLRDVGKAAEQLSEPEFYDITYQSLVALNDLEVDLRIIELWYRMQMAILLGVGINLSTDENGMKLVEGANYRFDVGEMAFIFDVNGRYSSEHIKVLRIVCSQLPHVIAQIKNIQQLLDTCLMIGRIAHE